MTESMSEMRAWVRDCFAENIDSESLEFTEHCPWTIVSFMTLDPSGEEVFLQGASKVCHPDKWDSIEGRNTAIDRAVAWATREWIGPAVEVHIDE
jgi:hypothetical protein